VRGDRLTGVSRRFLTLADVAELLNVSASQAYALVRSGDLRGIKIGGRGQWRVEEAELERFIAERYEQTERFIAEHPFARGDDTDDVLAPDSTTR
jgi:excisionase family DNA binding protein